MLWVDKIPAQSTSACYFSETILGQKYYVESFEVQNLRLHFFNTPLPTPNQPTFLLTGVCHVLEMLQHLKTALMKVHVKSKISE